MSLICPHCGREFDAARCKPLTPIHSLVLYEGKPVADVFVGGSQVEVIKCPGSQQNPRNGESDKRPLWIDGGVP